MLHIKREPHFPIVSDTPISGMLVEAPRKDGKDKKSIVDDILKKAAE